MQVFAPSISFILIFSLFDQTKEKDAEIFGRDASARSRFSFGYVCCILQQW
jgi:hypothetical protein